MVIGLLLTGSGGLVVTGLLLMELNGFGSAELISGLGFYLDRSGDRLWDSLGQGKIKHTSPLSQPRHI